MDLLKISPPVSLEEDYLHKKRKRSDIFPSLPNKQKTNNKIYDLAIEKIPHPSNELIDSKMDVTIVPQFLLRFFPALFKKMHQMYLPAIREEDKQKEKPSLYSYISLKTLSHFPIGIQAHHENGWFNAFLQFMLFVPSLHFLFDLLPKSLQEFNHFVDGYIEDQERKRVLTHQSSLSVLSCLKKKFSQYFLSKKKKTVLYDLIYLIAHSIEAASYQNLLKWHVVCSGQNCHCLSLDQHIADSIQKWRKKFGEGSDFFPPEILVAFSKDYYEDIGWGKNLFMQPSLLAKRQYFFSNVNKRIFSYELESFVEMRPDDNTDFSAVTYIKHQGRWYLCDDERIKSITSNFLSLPLSRGVLFHYKRTAFI